MAAASNEQLLTQVRAGERHAWDEIVQRFSGRLWAVARAQGLDRHSAADVVQTTWLALLDNIDRIREPAALPGWLSSVTRNEAMRVSKRGRRSDIVDDVESVSTSTTDTPIDNQLLAREDAVAVRRALARVSERCRELLTLMFSSDELSYGAIATLIDCPLGSLGPTRARCLEQLRRFVEAEGITYSTGPSEP
jgi:RNA polymerase sigma factor (sigma-70 family)